MRELFGVEEPLDCFVAGDAGGDEDCRDDGQPGELFAAVRTEQERDPKGHGGERVADVVDQVGEQRDAAGGDEDDRLKGGGQAEDAEADGDGADAIT